MKVAKLVYLSLVTRVIVDESSSEQQIVDVARSKFIEQINDSYLIENIESIVNDVECPFEN